jgi:hypothetical protein
VSSLTEDLLVRVLAEERNGLGLFEVAQPFAFDIGQDLLGDGAKSRLVVFFSCFLLSPTLSEPAQAV